MGPWKRVHKRTLAEDEGKKGGGAGAAAKEETKKGDRGGSCCKQAGFNLRLTGGEPNWQVETWIGLGEAGCGF